MSTSADQAIGFGGRPFPTPHQLFDGLPAFEQACVAVEASRLGDPVESATLLARWHDGVALLDAIFRAKSDASRPAHGDGSEPRIVAAMTRLATAWLSPRFAGEPRVVSRKRIASLRPVGPSERLRELMSKNTEGTLTPEERSEFLRLHKFFETLQDIVDAALFPTPAQL